jgi:two-component system phosphate regulon sensor histidine kinase PhoR
MSCITSALKVTALVLVSALVGWLYGHAAIAVILTLSMMIFFWLYEMHALQRWLNEPQSELPETFGIWSDLLALIHSHQRKSQKVQGQLQATIEYLQNSFAAIRDGVVMVNEQGVITWFNRAVEPLLGLRYPQDTGQTLTNLIREPEFNDYFIARDYSEPLQFRAAGRNEQSFIQVEITQFGEGDRVLFIRDISKAVHLEQMRSDFVANVSHELRTPLTVISGYLGTMDRGDEALPVRYRKPLEQMEQQAHRMENLLRDLLWLSKIESEQSVKSEETVDVRRLVQELRDELREAYPQAIITLELTSALTVEGNYQQLYSAVSNLAINAIKYSNDGSPITISWSEYEGRRNLCVSDTGIGIDAIHIPRLTERFYRIDDSRHSATGGTGLGLAIVKHVAASHDAELLIDSKPGEGSSFTLIFEA